MPFDGATTNPGSGGITLAVDTFTDTDSAIKTMPYSALAFGPENGPYVVTSAANPFPVAQTGALPAGTNVIGHVITDTGSTTAVTGTVAVTQSGSWTVDVAGVATAANQATEIASLASIDTKITACNTGAVVVTTSSLPNGAATSEKQDTGNASLSSIDGKTPALGQALAAASIPVVLPASQLSTLTPLATVAATQSGAWTVLPGNTANTTAWLVTGAGGSFPVTDSGGSLTVDNAGTFAVQAAQSGTWNVGTLSTITNVVHVDDNGGSLTVDGTVAVSGSVAVTNVGTFATQITGAALTSLELIDDTVATSGAAVTAKGLVVVGTDGTNARVLKTDTSGELQVDVLTLPSLPAGTNGIGKLTANSGVTIGAVEIAATQTLAMVTTVGTVSTITNVVHVDDNGASITVDGTVGVSGSVAVTNAGTFAVQAAQSGTWTVTGSGGSFPVTDSGGSLTIDAPVGTPAFVRLSDGSAAITTLPVSLASVPSHAVTNAGTFAVQATVSAGTALMGQVSASPETGTIYNGTTALTPKFAVIAASGSGNNTLVSAVASKKIRVLAYNFIGNGAVNGKFQSGAGGTDLTGLKYIAAAGGGICANFNPAGWFETAVNTLLNLNLSGAVAVGGELVYVEV